MIPFMLAQALANANKSESEGEGAQAYAQAVADFWGTAMTGFGNSVANSSAVVSIMKTEIEAMFKDSDGDGDSKAKAKAKCIDTAFKMLMTSGPATQITLTAMGKTLLEQDLKAIYASINTPEIAGLKEATAIYNYSTMSLVNGIIAGAPPIPVSGPLM